MQKTSNFWGFFCYLNVDKLHSKCYNNIRIIMYFNGELV